jgi:hypothetical protein
MTHNPGKRVGIISMCASQERVRKKAWYPLMRSDKASLGCKRKQGMKQEKQGGRKKENPDQSWRGTGIHA